MDDLSVDDLSDVWNSVCSSLLEIGVPVRFNPFLEYIYVGVSSLADSFCSSQGRSITKRMSRGRGSIRIKFIVHHRPRSYLIACLVACSGICSWWLSRHFFA